ncbi:MAG: Ig-like domain-containing protein, partial [Ginsengibacter sp.]
LDVSFNTSGTLKDLYKAKGATIFLDAALQADKKVVAAGQVWNGSNYDFVMARYLDNGQPDATFGTGGYTTLDFNNLSATATSIVILNDGKILVAGSTSGKFALARFKQDGSPDITFNSTGYRVYSFDASVARTIKIKVQDDGKIDALAGHTLARFASDGNLDVSFDGDGQVYVDLAVSGDLAIQADGKIIVSGRTSYMAAIRYRPDGSIDTDFSGGKVQYLFTDYDEEIGAVASSILIQPDGKILLGGHTRFYNFARQPNHWAIARLNTDGTLDNTFNGKGTNYYSNYADEYVTSMALQDDGRIILGGYSNGASTQTPGIYNFQLRRLTADGQPDNTFGNSGTVLSPVGNGDSRNYKILISGDRILAVGQAQFANTVGVIVAYKLTDQPAATPSITLSTPYDIIKYSSPARIKLNAVVNDAAAAIKKVRFYSGTTLLHTETKAPYGFLWDNVATGDYTLTAKAYDENDEVITSNEIHVAVIDANVAPYVSMKQPSMDTSYTGPADIRLIANAKDPNGRITKLDFFVGNTLLFSQKYYPYNYTWRNVQPGTYVVTAVATDNEGLSTTSAPVTITVTNANLPTVGSPFPANGSDAPGGLFSFKLSPNPVANMLTVSIEGLQDKTGQLTLLNFSGAVLKHYNTGSDKRVQIDVSSLAKGMYILKYTSGEKVTYKRFIKM